MNRSSRLEQTQSALENVPTSVSLDWAAEMLEYWQNELQGATDSETQNIAKNLAELRRHLLGGNPEAGVIGPLLTRLGQATITVAPSAGENLREELKHLGALLIAAGERLGEP